MNFQTFLALLNDNPAFRLVFKVGSNPLAVPSNLSVTAVSETTTTVDNAVVNSVVLTMTPNANKKFNETTAHAKTVVAVVDATACAAYEVSISVEGKTYHVVSSDVFENYVVCLVA